MTFKDDYINKKLKGFYRRKISKRSLDLTREECDKKYGSGDFFHLNCHSKFSILNGVNEPLELFETAKNNGMQGLAVTETGYLSSIPDCYLASKSTNLKYLVGMSAYFSDYEEFRRSLLDNPNDDIKNHPALILNCKTYRTPQITIIAKNQEGYKELLNLNAKAWECGYYYVPKITRSMLKNYTNGNLIILSGNLIDKFIEFGYIYNIENRDYKAVSAYEYMEWFSTNFGDDFYMELTMRCQDNIWGSDLDRMMTTYSLMNRLNNEYGIKPNAVITNDVRYIDRKHSKLLQALSAIGRNSTLSRIIDHSSEVYFKTRSELRATYHECLYDRAIKEMDFEKYCDASIAISEKCNTFIADTNPKLPEIDNADEILKEKTIKSLVSKGLHKNKTKYEVDGEMVTYFEQAKIELNRFIEKGFSSYFLIMQDLVNHSYDNNWVTGPSRGCSLPDSPVYTIDGYKPISYIKPNDLIYDMFGDIKKVLNQLCYKIDEEIIEIEYGDTKISVTSDHKLYVVRNKQVIIIKACEIKDADELIISQDLL